MQINWREVGFVSGAGAVGGLLSWIYSEAVNAPLNLGWFGSPAASILLGMGAVVVKTGLGEIFGRELIGLMGFEPGHEVAYGAGQLVTPILSCECVNAAKIERLLAVADEIAHIECKRNHRYSLVVLVAVLTSARADAASAPLSGGIRGMEK